MEFRKLIATTIREYLNEEMDNNKEFIAYHGSGVEFDNFLDIMNIALTRPFESITQLDFKLRKRIDASDLRNKDNLNDLNTKIMNQF